MSLLELFYGGAGPMLYDDTSVYPDMAPMEASRAPQHYIENEPTELYHVVRLSGLTSKLTSVSVAGGADSEARSMATSAGTRASAVMSYAYTVHDIADNAHSDASIALSKLASHGL
jgi:hypothetical protein